jgi:[ribosomal protein S5]-alanine N-acetyltransferase
MYLRENMDITLRVTTSQDLEQLFLFQLDPEACYLAAFMAKDHADKEAYIAKYTKFLSDPDKNLRTILVNGLIAGSVSKYVMEGDAEITYWIDKQYWGQGVATKALNEFLKIETTRPIYGRVAFDNIGSQRVLEKCGFIKVGTDRGFASARQTEIEEYVFIHSANSSPD